MVELGLGPICLISQGQHGGSKTTPGCWVWLPRHRTAWGLSCRNHDLGCNVVQDLQFGAAGFSFLLRGPGDNNGIQAHSRLIPNSYEEILDRKGIINIGASGTVS